ncbi:MAG: hypothetical protein J1E61_01255 [Lachnospiraceae bacterium]|nr:hypothetical protein [Lachnospiraceae bacterium]
MAKAQTKYKDTVFRFLFSDPVHALSLYNAINGTDYHDPALLTFNTLENAIYMNIKNDLSFLLANQVNVYEQQSTPSANIPLRDLFYIADLFQKQFLNKSIYSSKRVQIPTPHFVVLYNGIIKQPEYMQLKLSDSFASLQDTPMDAPGLELKVDVYNINKGMNEELKAKCPVLREYTEYIDTVRNYAKTMDISSAVEKAVDDCIRQNILREFLLKQKSEVVKMSIYDFDMEQEMKLLRQDEREIGREEGVLSIIRKLIQKGMDETQIINLLDCTEEEYAKAAMD